MKSDSHQIHDKDRIERILLSIANEKKRILIYKDKVRKLAVNGLLRLYERNSLYHNRKFTLCLSEISKNGYNHLCNTENIRIECSFNTFLIILNSKVFSCKKGSHFEISYPNKIHLIERRYDSRIQLIDSYPSYIEFSFQLDETDEEKEFLRSPFGFPHHENLQKRIKLKDISTTGFSFVHCQPLPYSRIDIGSIDPKALLYFPMKAQPWEAHVEFIWLKRFLDIDDVNSETFCGGCKFLSIEPEFKIFIQKYFLKTADIASQNQNLGTI